MSGMRPVLNAEEQEQLALALEEAALRVRQHCPDQAHYDIEDNVPQIGDGLRSIEGKRSPALREFRIHW